MKSIILIIGIMVSTIGFAQNEISGFYSLSGFDGNVDCNIFLYKNGSYFLELSENVTDDIVESLALSYGKFSLTNNEVTLIDKIHNYKMRLVLENKTLKVKQAFSFLISKRFFLHDNSIIDETEFISPNINAFMLQKERKSYNISHNKLIPLCLGVYEDGQGYKLSIQQNNKYKLEFKNIVLSEGKWCRNTNELELKDINLRCSFYLLIDNKKLVSKLLLGDYKSFLLIYK